MQTEINYKLLCARIIKKRPSLEMLMKISYILDEPVDYFLKDSSHACRKYIINEELTPILKGCTS